MSVIRVLFLRLCIGWKFKWEPRENLFINDVAAILFKKIISFIYTFEVKDLDLVAKDLLPVAVKYDIEKIWKLRVKIVFRQTIKQKRRFADAYKAKILHDKVIWSFLTNKSDVINSKEFEKRIRSHPTLMAKTLQRIYLL